MAAIFEFAGLFYYDRLIGIVLMFFGSHFELIF